jgi:hypothetical protein
MDLRERLSNFFKRNKLESIVSILTLLIAGVGYALTGIRYPNDDQFILYRYIDHIAHGAGFTWNYGEKVLGATTPLFTLVAAGAKLVLQSVPTPTVVAGVNVVLLALAAFFFARVTRHFLSETWTWVVCAVFAFDLSKAIPEGMETPLFLLTAFGFLDALFRKRWIRSSVFLALCVLTRPDAALIAVLAAIYWWQKENLKTAIKLSVISFAVALPWLAFAQWYFGSFVPQSLITKTHGHAIYTIPRLQAFKVQLASISRILWGNIYDPENLALQSVFNLFPVLALVVVGMKKFLSKDTWILFAIPLLYFVSFSLSNPLMFPWYASQMEPFWILMAGLGAAMIGERIKDQFWKLAFILLLVIGPAWFYLGELTTNETTSKASLFAVSEFLNENALPQDTIGLSNIGIVGWVVDRETIDFIGLVRNDSVKYYPIKDECPPSGSLYTIPPKLIEDSHPTWLVAGEGEMQSCFLRSDWFGQHYLPVYQYPSSTLRVWKYLP